ncbi:MAG: hypothetical protein WAV95_07610 [Azonexus sp.]
MLTPEAAHQKLHALCQQAARLMEDDSATNNAAFHTLLNDLAIFAREHFAAEEERLRQTNPALLDSRLAEHIEYESQLMDILIAASDGVLDKNRLHRFLTEWWSLYSLQSDKPLRNA